MLSGRVRNSARRRPIPLNDPTLDPILATGKMERDLGYLDIPIIVQLAQRRDGGFRVGAGPQIGILLSAKDRYAGVTPQGTPVVIENDIEKATQRFDAGVAFDAEYRFTGIPLGIGVRYYYGLTHVMKGPGSALHNQVLSGSGRISLGVSQSSEKAGTEGLTPHVRASAPALAAGQRRRMIVPG